MLKIKTEEKAARLCGLQPQMIIAVMVMDQLFTKLNSDCVITCGSDGTHKEYSSHYSGNALDFRTRGLTREQCRMISVDAQEALGEDYYVLLEGDHIHVQYRPRKPLT